VNAIMYILTTGCQWRALPKDLPPRSTVHDYLDLWSYDGTDFAYVHATPVSAGLGWRNQRFDQRPFFIGEITQLTAIIAPAVFRRPPYLPPAPTKSSTQK
jgi:hypothetical protein